MSALLLGLSPARRRMEEAGLAFQRCQAALVPPVLLLVEEERAELTEAAEAALAALPAPVPRLRGLPPMPAAWRARIAAVLEAHDRPWSDVAGASRTVAIVRVRHAIMYALCGLGPSLPQIGRVLGDRDHTTVLHGIRAHAGRLLPRQPEGRS